MDAFDPQREELEQLREDYRKGGIADVAVKRRLVGVLDELLSPIRARRRILAANQGLIEDLIARGEAKARPVAAATLAAVRDAMGLSLRALKGVQDSTPRARTARYAPNESASSAKSAGGGQVCGCL